MFEFSVWLLFGFGSVRSTAKVVSIIAHYFYRWLLISDLIHHLIWLWRFKWSNFNRSMGLRFQSNCHCLTVYVDAINTDVRTIPIPIPCDSIKREVFPNQLSVIDRMIGIELHWKYNDEISFDQRDNWIGDLNRSISVDSWTRNEEEREQVLWCGVIEFIYYDVNI